MATIVFLLIFYLVTPLILEYLAIRFQVLNKIGSVLLSYGIGLALAQFIQHTEFLKQVQMNVSGLAIMLALPILLMDLRLSSLKSIVGKIAISSIIAMVSVVFVVGVSYQFYKDTISDSWQIAGMMVGIYTGGTINLASIQQALGVSQDTYIAVHTFDTLWTTIYLFVLMLYSGQFSFRKNTGAKNEWHATKRFFDAIYWLKRDVLKNTGIQLGIAILVAGLAFGFGFLFRQDIRDAAIMLLLTTFGVCAALFISKTSLKMSSGPGGYFLNMFGLALASMADFRNIMDASPSLISWIAIVLFGSFVLHFVIGKLFKVDTATTMVVSVAYICSPPFVPIISKSYRRNDLLLPGLVVGVLGYVIGNYLGVLVAFVLRG